jgi:hypothetical protein
MSGNIGDKARFNRLRKQKLQKRLTKAKLKAERAAGAAPAANEATTETAHVAETQPVQASE